MEKLYSNKDFYSVVSTLENININIENNNFSLAEKLYLKLLNDKNLQPVYIAAIASHASYTFLNVQFDNLNMNLINLQVKLFLCAKINLLFFSKNN